MEGKIWRPGLGSQKLRLHSPKLPCEHSIKVFTHGGSKRRGAEQSALWWREAFSG